MNMMRGVMPKAPTLPQSPEELLEQLFTIFPEYRASYPGPIHDEQPSFHSVLISFSPCFGQLANTSSEKQLRSFWQLVNAAVEAGGVLENAFGTCLLEHLQQLQASRAFPPYLSKLPRERTKT